MSKSRELGISVLLLVLGGGLALLCVGRTWWHGILLVPNRVSSTTVTGRNAGVDDILPLVCMAAAGAVLATRGRTRVAVGLLSTASAIGLFGVVLHALGKSQRYVGLPPHVDSGAHYTAWPYLAVVGAVLAAIGAVMVVVRGSGWPALGQRYEAPGGKGSPGPVAAQAVSDRGVWDALDRGEDPT